MSAIAANSTSPVWFYCKLADLYCAHRQNYDCASACTGVPEIPAPPIDLGAIDSLDDRDYDPAEDADSEIGGYYPDQSAAPGSNRYGKTAPRRVEFVAPWYIAVCNAVLPTT